MIKILSLSFLLSVFSVVVIIAFPVNISDDVSSSGLSPYREQIDELHIKTSTGLPPNAPEWEKLDELTKKNNEWFESKGDLSAQSEALSAFDILKVKSSKISLLLMFVWGFSFYFFLKNNEHRLSILALVFPVLMFLFSIISILTLSLISFSVLGVYFFVFFRCSMKPK